MDVLKFIETPIPGVIVVEPQVHSDDRGFFLETYHEPKYRAGGIDATFVQDNHARSSRGVLRGLHGQFPRPQGKLVRAVEGEVFDVAVDVRRGSPTFGRYYATTLSEQNFRQMYIPPGVIHGYVVISDFAQFEYKCTDVYHPDNEFSVAWNEPDFAIAWPIDDPILSAKDRSAPRLRDLTHKLAEFPG